MKRRGMFVAVAVAALSVAAVGAQERGADERVAEGGRVFMEQGCYGCHTVKKIGTPMASDLSHIGGKYDERQLRTWLRDPAAQRPSAHMPRLELTEPQIIGLAAFLASLQ